MREYNILLDKGLLFGLRASAEERRNSGRLIQSTGLAPEGGALRSLDAISRIDTSAISASFPYPQLFILRELVLVCTATEIYEYDVDGDSLSLAIGGLTEGITWSVADFGRYVVLVNGKEVVTRSGDGLSWSKANSDELPVSSAIANVNGQAIFCAPDAAVPDSDV